MDNSSADQPSGTGPTQGGPAADPAGGGRSASLASQLVIYTVMRLGLVAVITVVLTFVLQIPLIVSLLLAIIMQMPLSMILFNGQRRRVTDLINVRSAVRRSQRDSLRQALRGDEGQ